MDGDDRKWWTRTPQERQADLDRLREAVTQPGTVASSDGHEVTVTVGPGGALGAIEISSLGMRLDASRLGDVITRTVALATTRSRDAMAARIAEVTGGRGYVAGIGAALPAPVDESAVPVLEEADDDTDLERGFRDLAARSRTQLRGYAAAREDLAGRTVTAHSADRTVSVTATADGTVTSIDIDDDAYRHGAGVLGNRIRAAIQEARARAAALTAERIQQVPGVRFDVRDLVAEVQKEVP